MSLQNCESGMTEQTLRRRKEIQLRERARERGKQKNWLMFQKQPRSGIPQAGRWDNHLLAFLHHNILSQPSQCCWVKRTFRSGVSGMRTHRGSKPGMGTRGNTNCYCRCFFCWGRSCSRGVVLIIWCERSLSVCLLPSQTKNRASQRQTKHAETMSYSFFVMEHIMLCSEIGETPL